MMTGNIRANQRIIDRLLSIFSSLGPDEQAHILNAFGLEEEKSSRKPWERHFFPQPRRTRSRRKMSR